MPLYYTKCSTCGTERRVILTSRDKSLLGCKCGGEEDFISKLSVQTRVMEVLDNGIMPRRVERPANAEELQRDHSTPATKSDTLV